MYTILALLVGGVIFAGIKSTAKDTSGKSQLESAEASKKATGTDEKSSASSLKELAGGKRNFPDSDAEDRDGKVGKIDLHKPSILIISTRAGKGTSGTPSAQNPHSQWFKDEATKDLK